MENNESIEMTVENRAQALIEALPYIKKYNGKTVVIKYGGNAMVSKELQEAVISDIVMLSLVGIRVVVVHGGGPDINRMLKLVGKDSKFVNGLRYTDKETMDIVQMVLCGKVNKNIVNMINRTGGRGVGLCGIDDNFILAKKLNREDGFDYGLVGDIVEVDPDVLNKTLDMGIIPVVSSVALGTDGNECYNVNADTVASEIAISLKAEKLILMTDIKGVMENPEDERTLISQIKIGKQLETIINKGIIKGGMIPKVQCCKDAVNGGVVRTHILDGRIPHAILIEILSHSGIGTMIWKGD